MDTHSHLDVLFLLSYAAAPHRRPLPALSWRWRWSDARGGMQGKAPPTSLCGRRGRGEKRRVALVVRGGSLGEASGVSVSRTLMSLFYVDQLLRLTVVAT